MSLGLILVGVLGAGLTYLLAFLCSPQRRLLVAALLAIPQFVVPGLPSSFSLFQLWIVCMALTPGWRHAPFGHIYTKILMSLAGLSTMAALWSPLPVVAVISGVQIASLAILMLYAGKVYRENPDAFSKIFGWLGVGIVVESLLVILFRIRPDMELSFLRSEIARILIGTERLQNFFYGSRDNVHDVVKSGGLWLNANTASMFLGIAACVFIVGALKFRKKSFLLVSVLAAASVVPTGSKSGLSLLMIMPVVGVFVALLARRSGRLWVPAAITAVFPATYIFTYIISEWIPETLANDSASSLGTRGVIWETAGRLFLENPFVGLGFGGWDEMFVSASSGTLGRSFPPHNIFIAAWSEMGLAGAIILMVLVVLVLLRHIRLAAISTTVRESFAWGLGLAAFLWLFIHGMADAVTFYGDLKTMLLIAMLLGIMGTQPSQLVLVPRRRPVSGVTAVD